MRRLFVCKTNERLSQHQIGETRRLVTCARNRCIFFLRYIHEVCSSSTFCVCLNLGLRQHHNFPRCSWLIFKSLIEVSIFTTQFHVFPTESCWSWKFQKQIKYVKIYKNIRMTHLQTMTKKKQKKKKMFSNRYMIHMPAFFCFVHFIFPSFMWRASVSVVGPTSTDCPQSHIVLF